MKWFLSFRHWQVFGVIFIIPLLLVMNIGGFSNTSLSMIGIPLICLVAILVYFDWLYALGSHLHEQLPETVTMSLNWFQWLLFIPTVNLIFVFIVPVLPVLQDMLNNYPYLLMHISVFISFPALLCCLVFIAKALKSVELQRPVKVIDYAGEFLLLWYLPFGVWFIQPRINRIFDPAS